MVDSLFIHYEINSKRYEKQSVLINLTLKPVNIDLDSLLKTTVIIVNYLALAQVYISAKQCFLLNFLVDSLYIRNWINDKFSLVVI